MNLFYRTRVYTCEESARIVRDIEKDAAFNKLSIFFLFIRWVSNVAENFWCAKRKRAWAKREI